MPHPNNKMEVNSFNDATKQRLSDMMFFSVSKDCLGSFLKCLNRLANYGSDAPTIATLGAESYSKTDFWVKMEILTLDSTGRDTHYRTMWHGGLNYSESLNAWSINT